MTQINAGNVEVTLPPGPAKRRLPWAAVGVLVLSGLGALGSFGLAASLGAAGLYSQTNQRGLPIQTTETLSLALTALLTGILLVPPIVLALLRILENHSRPGAGGSLKSSRLQACLASWSGWWCWSPDNGWRGTQMRPGWCCRLCNCWLAACR